MALRPYIVGNWKMNGARALQPVARSIDRAVQGMAKVEVAIAPPFPLISGFSKEAQSLAIGAQDCHFAPEGAYTGDVSAPILADSGASFVILGHSERRQGHGESNALVRDKVTAALEAGLKAIVCVGEEGATREAGEAERFVTAQVEASLPVDVPNAHEMLTIAYEPIWAIGTGKTPSLDEIGAMHRAIRARMTALFGEEVGSAIRILYGGSVNAQNAADILAIEGVDGALVGGASLAVESFVGIVIAAAEVE